MPQLTFEPVHADFGARVKGVDLSEELPQSIIEEIHAAIDTYSFLCFADQSMSNERQLAFTKRLGEPEEEHVHYGMTGEKIFLGTVGNVIDDKTIMGNDDAHSRYQKGNEMWHSDSSFRLVPSFVSITHAYEVPGEGGTTEFVSQRAAYERLSQEVKTTIDPLLVLHDYVFSRSKVAPVDPNHAASLPPIENRLVRTNPSNGRKNYYVGSHARSIVGWSGVASRQLIDDLLQWATRTQDIYSHQWQVGETVIWDNRCLLHRGGGYDADRWRRRMQQTRVRGTGPTIDE